MQTMGVLTSQQTTEAVRGLLYFGAHEYQGDIDLGDCTAEIQSTVTPSSAPTTDKEAPLDEHVEVKFCNVRHNDRPIEGVITVTAKIRWPSLHDRLKIGNPNFRVVEQPSLHHERLTRNCLVAFSRMISKHNEEVNDWKAKMADIKKPDQDD